jgi:uncharacterized protein (DUF924 family)
MGEAWVCEVLDFWLPLGEQAWFSRSDQLDAEVRERFQLLWEAQRQQPVEAFLGTAEEAAAAAILFDQFPRNMFRGHADSFATDHLALAVAKEALDKGYDDQLSKEARIFLLMPFQHSEKLYDQERSLLEFTRLGDPDPLRFAKLHHDVIARFGRFPHRNAILGRRPRPDEIAAGDVTPW